MENYSYLLHHICELFIKKTIYIFLNFDKKKLKACHRYNIFLPTFLLLAFF